MAAADYISYLIVEVVAWQIKVGRQRIPNKHSDDRIEARFGNRFAKLLLRRGKALGEKRVGDDWRLQRWRW